MILKIEKRISFYNYKKIKQIGSKNLRVDHEFGIRGFAI